MARRLWPILIAALLAGCATSVPTPRPAITPSTSPFALPSASAPPTTIAPSGAPAALAACGAGSVSARIEEISPTQQGQDAWVLFGLDRSSGACRLSRLSAVTVQDATHKTVVKVSDGGLWTSDLSVALAVRLNFLSLCPRVKSLPLSVELDLGNGTTVTSTLPRSFAVPCNDGSHRAFIDGIVEAPGTAPSPGGTCSAGQFDLGTASSFYDLSALGTRHVVVEQPLRNAGATCILEVPGSIGVASGLGPFQAVSAINTGNEVCAQNACHYVTPSSYTIAAGQALSLGFGGSWWIGGASDTGTPAGMPPCDQALSKVNRAEFPVASGSIEIHWSLVLQQVCSAPASVSFAIEPQ